MHSSNPDGVANGLAMGVPSAVRDARFQAESPRQVFLRTLGGSPAFDALGKASGDQPSGRQIA